MLFSQFEEIYKTRGQNRIFQSIIDKVLLTVDFSDDRIYKRDFHSNGVLGILQKYGGNYIWSWMNTINTNHSCIYYIIDTLNGLSNEKLTLELFKTDSNRFFSLFESLLDKNKNIIFRKGSEIFTKMFFITQNTWNIGIISMISAVYTINERFKTSITFNFNRGDSSDMNEGCDFIIFINNEPHKTQHKKIKYFNEVGDFYVTKTFIYNEKTYRNNLDLISIDNEDKIYLFRNSKDTSLCGTDSNGNFFIHKSLIVEIMTKQKEKIENLLLELNRLCFQKRMIFSFNKGESGENYFEEEIIGDTSSLCFYLNNIDDKKLPQKIQEQINKLK